MAWRRKKSRKERIRGSDGKRRERTNTDVYDASTEERGEDMTDAIEKEHGEKEETKHPDGEGAADEDRDDSESNASVAVAQAAASEVPSDRADLDEDLIPESILNTYFKRGKRDGNAASDENDTLALPHHDDADQKGKGAPRRPVPVAGISDAQEERIVFDAWDNKQVEGINNKAKATLDKAGLELGDYSLDTVFKGNYPAMMNPRSKEYKRFRKLWKHPELLLDPRRWREWTGAAAVRKLCLGEGIDVSSLSGSHLIELYYAKDRDLILTLAEEATTREYSVRRLKRAIEDHREEKADDPGKTIIKTLDQSFPLLEDPDLMGLCTDKGRVLVELSKAERQRIRSLIDKRKPGVDQWKEVMEGLERILTELGND